MSQLVARLQERIRSETDPLMLAELEARLAGNEARLGNFIAARQRIARLREAHSGARTSVATLWIMLAEGLLLFYEDLDPSALDRITRAEALARAMGCVPLAGLCAAWKAHIEFQNADYMVMAHSLTLARQCVSEHDLEGQTRIAIVVSSALMMCGQVAAAQHWHRRGRDLAIRSGDRASIEALQYNRAALLLARVRLESCQRSIERNTLDALQGEIKTSINLQHLVQIGALANHIELWSARLDILKGQWTSAIEALGRVRAKEPFAKHNFSQALIDLEICFCQGRAGDMESAIEHSAAFDPAALVELELDEQIVAAWMQWQLSLAHPHFGDATLHHAALQALLEREATQSRRLEQAMVHFLTPEEHGT